MSTARHDATRPARTAQAVDNTDWLKTAAIILVSIDHMGYFFMGDDRWWAALGRLAAPIFFFLIGFAQTRTVPLYWIWLGVILTLLDSWNNGWSWVAPNILLSFALIRIVRPYARDSLQRYGWSAFAVATVALLAVLPFAANAADYGAAGWLWALFGLCQRLYVDDSPAVSLDSADPSPAPLSRTVTSDFGAMRLLACLIAATAYVWHEQVEFAFAGIYFAAFVLGVGGLSLSLYLFRRGPSRIQPPEPLAATLRFIGRHTLEIYAIQLAGSELLIGLMPDLAP